MKTKKAVCKFCGQRFKSAQAVRAHLRWCRDYANTEPEGVPTLNAYEELEPQAEPKGFNPVRFMRDRVQEEEARLRLRELKSAHAELDREEQKSIHRGQKGNSEYRLALVRAHEDSEKERRREEEERRLRQEKRAVVQRVKDRAFSPYAELEWATLGITLTDAIRADVLIEIEGELAKLPVNELPESELISIACGIVQRRKEAEIRGVMDRESQKQRERDRRWQELATESQRDNQQRVFLQHAASFASRELEGEGLSFSDQWEIIQNVKQAVLAAIDNLKSKSDVEDLVYEVIDEAIDAD